jgi:hypothetical protein
MKFNVSYEFKCLYNILGQWSWRQYLIILKFKMSVIYGESMIIIYIIIIEACVCSSTTCNLNTK